MVVPLVCSIVVVSTWASGCLQVDGRFMSSDTKQSDGSSSNSVDRDDSVDGHDSGKFDGSGGASGSMGSVEPSEDSSTETADSDVIRADADAGGDGPTNTGDGDSVDDSSTTGSTTADGDEASSGGATSEDGSGSETTTEAGSRSTSQASDVSDSGDQGTTTDSGETDGSTTGEQEPIDLVPMNLRFDGGAVAGGPEVRMEVEIWNLGSIACPEPTWRVEFGAQSESGRIPSYDVKPGSYLYHANGLPFLSSGRQTITFILDPLNEFHELDETNNRISIEVDVGR